MFRHVFAILLVNTYYSSFGNPIDTNTSKYLLSNSLTELANHCGNEFLSSYIKSRVSDCALIAPPYSEKVFECLMFYDINTQLCAASPPPTLNAEDKAKINADLNVNDLCISAKDWVFTNLTIYDQYKNTADKVFKHPITCGKICGIEDVLSENANFYCKYFKWGSEKLKKSKASVSQSNVDINAVIAPVHPEIVQADNKPTLSAQNANNINNMVASDPPKENVQPSVQSTPAKTDESTKTNVKQETSSTKLIPSSDTLSKPLKNKNTDEHVNTDDNHDGLVDNVSPSNVEKPSLKKATTEKNKPIETGNNELSEHNGPEKNLNNSGVKPQNDLEDYGDPDEGRENHVDTIDGEDGDTSDVDPKPDQVENKNPPKPIEYDIPLMNIDSSQRQDIFPNTNQDGFSEDDDHFFPFFLTAIILVVLLYVLYHNKAKVSKVVMGLILEGRQPGRRRNSRGHAYRRLDTLEQAMNANAAAPPSKIIY